MNKKKKKKPVEKTGENVTNLREAESYSIPRSPGLITSVYNTSCITTWFACPVHLTFFAIQITLVAKQIVHKSIDEYGLYQPLVSYSRSWSMN